jgi:hypothetical protein
MASDDWRIRIEVEDAHDRLLERLGVELDDEARELARDLERKRLAVSRDGDDLFVYTSSYPDAQRALAVVEALLKQTGLRAKTNRIEHWLDAEDRWDNDPPGETWEEEVLDRGYAPWEVRVTCASRAEARSLAERLEGDGLQPIQSYSFVIVGAASREDADALAARLHGEVEAGGQVVYEALPGNPFAVFGGLA